MPCCLYENPVRAKNELVKHVATVVLRPKGSGRAQHYVAEGEWALLGRGGALRRARSPERTGRAVPVLPGARGRGGVSNASAGSRGTARPPSREALPCVAGPRP